MKKLLSVVIAAVLALVIMTPVSALDFYSTKIENVFDTLPSMYENAVIIPFGEFWVDGETNARHGNASGNMNEFDYVYLKADGNGDFTVPFTVDASGLYEFGFTLMGWEASVPRSTNVQIDDSEYIYISYDYAAEDKHYNHYWYGISAVLEPGEHSITLSLADDFDDAEVKSLYFVNAFYVQGELPAPEELPVVKPVEELSVVSTENEAADAPVTTSEPEATELKTAAQTSDFIGIVSVALIVSVSGMIVSKKRK